MKWNEVTESCPTLCDPVDCSPPGCSVHGDLQAKYWSVLPCPLSQPRDWTQVSHLAGRFFTIWATSESESEVAQSCPTLCNSVDCSLPGSTIHGIFHTGVGCHFLLQEIFPTQGLNPGLPHCRHSSIEVITIYHKISLVSRGTNSSSSIYKVVSVIIAHSTPWWHMEKYFISETWAKNDTYFPFRFK